MLEVRGVSEDGMNLNLGNYTSFHTSITETEVWDFLDISQQKQFFLIWEISDDTVFKYSLP
jgi:hypothetical protein